MGKNATGEKPKFDLINTSKTKKYKIIFGVILVFGVLLLIGGIILHGTLTETKIPNTLIIENLSNYNDNNGDCIISTDEMFVIKTGTPIDHALSSPITFSLDENAQKFVVVCDSTNQVQINQSNYQGYFWLHIINNNMTDRITGKLTITCGSRAKVINLEYHPI